MIVNFTHVVKRLLLFTFILSASIAFAQQPEVKIDFNMNNRPPAQVQEPGYTPWTLANGLLDSITVDGIKFLVKKGPRGTTLSQTWYSASVQAGAFNARFTNDAIFVKDGDFALGTQIDIVIKGLPAGQHTLITYHNIPDFVATENICPIDVYVNNVLTINNLIPTVRLEKTTDCATSEVQLTVAEGEVVTMSYRAETSGAQPVKNLYINGLQLNGVNASKKSRSPNPSNKEEHLDVPMNGSYLLQWQGAPSIVSHDVYFGTDSVAVANADRNSSYYKGSKVPTDTSYLATGLYPMYKYYWRIDEVTSSNTYKGLVWMFRTRQLAFPDAEGYGRFARGGRGGKVVEVTNLNDSGPGSLREAVTNNVGPRTIVFAVSGIIKLQSRLVLSNPYVTVAGQTAPGKGICIAGAPFGITGNDCIVRHVRVRLGAGPTFDGMGLTGANHSIMDHCSISWTIDEAFSSRSGKNITLQRTLISEALNIAGHQNYPEGTGHGYAATIGGSRGSYHHNLLAHNAGRNWSLGGGLDPNGFYSGEIDITNNVVYNWESRTTDGGAKEVNFVNNYYKPGPASRIFYALTMDHEGVGKGSQRAYFAGNLMPGRFTLANQTAGRRARYSNGDTSSYETFVSQPFFPSYVNTQSAVHAYKNVLSDVGATQPVFDDHDIRIINETRDSTTTYVGSKGGLKGIPDHQNDVGGYENYPETSRFADWDSDHDGMPNWWETLKGFNPNSSVGDFSESNGDPELDGVTNLEEYLEWMSNPHYSAAGATQKITIDLKNLARGYKSSPSFSTSGVSNGSVNLSNGVAEFTPAGAGFGAFSFTVTDSQGASMTRKINLVNGIDLTLPISLTSFEAERKDSKNVNLTWQTSQELNNDHFQVERSFGDATHFEKTGGKTLSKAKDGSSAATLSYEVNDKNSYSGDTYYRLLQKDKDGKTSLSEVRMVKGILEAGLNVWPIPNNGDFYVAVTNVNNNSVINIYDVNGRLIETQPVKNGSVNSIHVSGTGVYIVKVVNKSDNAVLFTQKVIVY